MKKKHLLASSALFISILFIFASAVFSQTPQYYNTNTGTSSNSFPFNVAGGKAVNSLFLAGEFSQPTPLPAGMQITKVYFRTSTAGTRTYTNLHILLKQDTITTLTTGSFYGGAMDTVYFNASAELTSIANGWMAVTLNKPFAYDPAKSLVMFVGHCGATGTNGSVYNSTYSGIRRVWSIGGCPLVAYAGGDGSMVNFGVDVAPAVNNVPDLLYYKFENNPTSTTVLNCAVPGVGTTTAPIAAVTLTPGGQFDTCITGTGLASSGVTTGYNWNIGASSWTISMWITIPTSTSGSAYYLFGDGATSFRCFHNGVALQDNLILRGTGVTDVTVTGIGPAPCVVTFVYDSVATNIKAYKNGVLANTITQTAFNFTGGTGFRVGGYTTSTSFIGKMDEFRLYKRALTAAEVLDLWDENIAACGVVVGTPNPITNIPNQYSLDQNYPNPFNPVTKISFALPKAGNVELVVFDVLGRNVATLVNGNLTAGKHTVDFNAEMLSSGVYFYTLKAGNFTDTKKMVLIK